MSRDANQGRYEAYETGYETYETGYDDEAVVSYDDEPRVSLVEPCVSLAKVEPDVSGAANEQSVSTPPQTFTHAHTHPASEPSRRGGRGGGGGGALVISASPMPQRHTNVTMTESVKIKAVKGVRLELPAGSSPAHRDTANLEQVSPSKGPVLAPVFPYFWHRRSLIFGTG